MRPAAVWTVPPPFHGELATTLPPPPPPPPELVSTVKATLADVVVLPVPLAVSFATTFQLQLPWVKPWSVVPQTLLPCDDAAKFCVVPAPLVTWKVTLRTPTLSVTFAVKAALAPMVAPCAGDRFETTGGVESLPPPPGAAFGTGSLLH